MSRRSGWLFALYTALGLAALPLIMLFVALRWRRRFWANGFSRWRERLGWLDAPTRSELTQGRWWWVHAVSLGEVKAIEPFLKRAPARVGVRVLLSAVTPEAIHWAERHGVADRVTAAPLDVPWAIRRVLNAARPAWFISVESEFWPNLLREAKRSGARVALVNGRVSERSFMSYRRWKPVMKAVFDCIDVWAVRDELDRQRFCALGIPSDRVSVTGNMKYDLPLPSTAGTEGSASAALALGSTREGEEEQILPVIRRLRQKAPELRVIWAPRHVERALEIERLLRSEGGTVGRRSSESSPSWRGDLIWDTVGDLLDAYRQAQVVVVGGSFVPKGGQNPLEPAALRKAVVFGPSMDNFSGIAEVLVREGGAVQVGLDQLESCLSRLLADGQERRRLGDQARRTLESRQGATERTLDLLMKAASQ